MFVILSYNETQKIVFINVPTSKSPVNILMSILHIDSRLPYHIFLSLKLYYFVYNIWEEVIYLDKR